LQLIFLLDLPSSLAKFLRSKITNFCFLVFILRNLVSLFSKVFCSIVSDCKWASTSQSIPNSLLLFSSFSFQRNLQFSEREKERVDKMSKILSGFFLWESLLTLITPYRFLIARHSELGLQFIVISSLDRFTTDTLQPNMIKLNWPLSFKTMNYVKLSL